MPQTAPTAEPILAALRQRQPLPATLVPADVETAYALQHAVHAGRDAQLGATVGYKLAYTVTELMQAAGLDEPLFARLGERGVRSSPARLDTADCVRFGIECEVAYRLGRDLPASGAPYTRDAVADAVDAVMPAIELLDFRFPDGLDDRQRALLGATVDIWNCGVVLGEPVAGWRALDLAAATGRVLLDGEEVSSGTGANVMGHPLEPLVWLANSLGRHGLPLTAGMTVITGSFVRPVMVEAGTEARIVIDGLGEVSVTTGA